jgi:type 2 lantibiotic biosynthesis protein LanM
VERAALLPAAPAGASPPPDPVRRLERWRRQPPFDQPGRFAERLAADGLDEASAALAAAPAPEAATGPVPAWVAELRAACAGPADPAAVVPDGAASRDPAWGFLTLVDPLLRRARDRLRAGLAGLERPGQPLLAADQVERSLVATVQTQLLWMIDRTAVLELNVARVRGQLAGDTGEARFRSFVDSLARPEVALGLFEEYAVLARAVVERLEAWVESSLELVHRLRDDRPALVARFFAGRDPGPLAELRAGAGDAHRGGRAVAILTFASGGRLVYKPRPLAVDQHFQELLAWLNRRGSHAPFRLLDVLDRGEYGWAEFVEALPCASQGELALYHRRLGGLLAVLHAVDAVDFHFQNLIAARDQPVAVDLESLFHPQLLQVDPERADERLAARAIGESVLRVGLLPLRIGEAEGGSAVDWSGVASVAGQLTPDLALDWADAGTDEMRAVEKPAAMAGGRNRPSLDGVEADIADHIATVAEGFEELYRLIARHRDELAAPGGPLERFAGDPVRVVLRASRAYGLLLEHGWHPDLLRDALERDRFFDRLWVGSDEMPIWRRAIAHEHEDLRRGDVPYFQTRPSSRDLWTSRGARVPGLFAETSLEHVRRRLAAMDEQDLERQSWLARVSLGTLLLNRDKGDWPGFEIADPGSPRGDADLQGGLVAAAASVGEWFERMAVRDGGDLTWITLDLRQGVWSLFPSSEDLYAGVPGIALFLAYLGSVTGDGRFARSARAAMQSLIERLERAPGDVAHIGLFQGWGGVAYAAAHLAVLWGDDALLRAGERAAETAAARVPSDDGLDPVIGSAGALMSFAALFRATGQERWLDAARACGDRLLAVARPDGDDGLSWPSPLGAGRGGQTGYAHGAAGIAAALVELGAATGDERPLRAAASAFAYERRTLWPEIERRIAAAPPASPAPPAAGLPGDASIALSWCYGAPGVGLSRIAALTRPAHLPGDRAALRAELDAAVRLTLERGFGMNHCLCHGDLGNLDFLLQAERLPGAGDLGERRRSLTRAILADVRANGPRCGMIAGIESPGLMTGLAGVGYGLLRLAEPDRVPSVLSMDPPPVGPR